MAKQLRGGAKEQENGRPSRFPNTISKLPQIFPQYCVPLLTRHSTRTKAGMNCVWHSGRKNKDYGQYVDTLSVILP